MTDQSQSGPPDRADDGPGAADASAALGPDAPTEVRPPPPEFAAAQDAQDVEAPAAVAPLEPLAPGEPPAPLAPPAPREPLAPLEPGDSPAVSPPTVPPVPDWSPEDDLSSGGPAALAAERPEVAVGAAFAGGLVLALILKRLAR